MSSRVRRVLLVLLVLAGTVAAMSVPVRAVALTPPGQTWSRLAPTTSPAARRAASMAYDPATAQMVLFGGTAAAADATASNDTWLWSGSTWSQAQAAGAASASRPSARSLASMAYDPATAQLLLFGGVDASGTRLNDTWVWSGSSWSQIATPAGGTPGVRSGASMEWDGATGQLVLFGGYDAGRGESLADTWTWTGTAWSQQTPTASPAARSQASLAYSPATGQLVLFGGQTAAGALLGDTWLWTGSIWQRSTPGISPSGRAGHTATFDPYLGRIALFGGCTTVCSDTWSWSGTTWRQEAVTTSPSSRTAQAAAFDPRTGALLLFGGSDGSATLADTWAHGASPQTGSSWRKTAGTGPGGRAGSATAYDAATGRLVLFGGFTGANGSTLLNDTWLWDGTSWARATTSGSAPPARKYASMTYDPATGQLLLFGGRTATGALADTWIWTWDGTVGTWTNVTPAAAGGSPSARWGVGLGFDAGTGQLLLYGGLTTGALQQDTWQWTGTTWARLATSSAAGPRGFTRVVFDASGGGSPTGGQLLLIGGVASTNTGLAGLYQLTGTFVWNGSTNWTQNANANTPGALAATTSTTAVDFDAVRGDPVLWDSATGRTARYAGTVWQLLSTATAPPTWSGDGSTPVDGDTTAVFDPSTGQLLVMGGWTAATSTYAADTWVLGFQAEAATAGATTANAVLTGYDQVRSTPVTLEVDTPAAAGWAVSVSVDRAPPAGATSVPGLVVTSSDATSVTDGRAVSPSCASGTCTAPAQSGAPLLPLTVPSSGSAVLFRAGNDSGVGRIVLPVRLWTVIPANVAAGTHTATVTVTVTSGP